MAKQKRGGRLGAAAASIGGTLGSVAARVDTLNKRRAVIAAELHGVIDRAQDMLAELGDGAVVVRRRARRTARKLARAHNRRKRGRVATSIVRAAKRRLAKRRKKS